MEIDKYEAIRLIKQQIEDQGCEGDDIDSLEMWQPHLYQWIKFFGLKQEDLK